MIVKKIMLFLWKQQIFSTSFLSWMFVYIMNNVKMLYYDKIEVSKWIDVNKTSESRECDICRYWYFLDKGFKF